MKILIAHTIGFCNGIKRAVRIANDLLSSSHSNVYTKGELTHNVNVMNKLYAAGLKKLNSLSENINKNDTILIRAHGVSPDSRNHIYSIGCNVSDATCPHVLSMSNILQQYAEDGYEMVIVGDNTHAEIIGLVGYCHKFYVMKNISEAKDFTSRSSKILVISQSTLDQTIFDEVCEVLIKKYPHIVIKNTICESTRNRQNGILDLKTRGAQAIVIVGGKHSANTKTLVEISRNNGLRTLHVENIDELKIHDLSGINAIGVASGASTDILDVRNIIDYLQLL